MTVRNMVGRFFAIALVSATACRSNAEAGFENYIKDSPHSPRIEFSQVQQPKLSLNQESVESKVLNQALAQHQKLGLCDFSFNVEQSKNSSQVYAVGPDQYLVQLLCFQAAYQGNYSFAAATVGSNTIELEPLNVSLAGYPEYDAKTKILTNSYKFRGLGDCIEKTEHRWTGSELRLLTSQLISLRPDSCKIFEGGDSYRITPSSIGLAKLGMTFAQLQAVMGDRASYRPINLGGDLGTGIEVSNETGIQFEIGSQTQGLMEPGSVISLIRVSNPFYKTENGVGPGTLLAEAVKAYGPASLSRNVSNESQELIHFGDEFPKTVWIRSNQSALGTEAGIYRQPEAEFQQTTAFREKAAIGSFTITLDLGES